MSTDKISQNTEVSPDVMERTIGIVAFPGIELIDLTGPLDTFAMFNEGFRTMNVSNDEPYKFKVIAKQPGLVTTSSGLRIHADCAYDDFVDEIDTLIVPGAPDVSAVLADPDLNDWVLSISNQVRRMVSVCTGAFLIADTGLLDNRRATTHWAYCDRLATEYPSVDVDSDRIFVRDDFIATSGGVTSGIDLSLALLEEDWGREAALLTAQYMVMFLKRPGGQTQFSAHLATESTKNHDIRALQMWIMDNPGKELHIDILADRIAMSPRNFARVFRVETGMTPAKFVEKVRIDSARQMLGESEQNIASVAVAAGFKDYERMRRAFVRHLGISPLEFRQRFTRHEPKPTPIVTPNKERMVWDALNPS